MRPPGTPGSLGSGSALDRHALFGTAARPSDGVGPSAIVTALADLDRALGLDRCHAVVATPQGPGRVLLFRALAERLSASYRVAQLPALGAPAEELRPNLLRSLGVSPVAGDEESQLQAVVAEIAREGSALVVLVADANALSREALRRLGRLAVQARPNLRLALGVAVESGGSSDAVAQIVAALGVSAEKIVLESRRDPAAVPVFRSLATRPPSEAPGERRREPLPLPAIHAAPGDTAMARSRTRSGWGASVTLASLTASMVLAGLALAGLAQLAGSPFAPFAFEEPRVAVARATPERVEPVAAALAPRWVEPSGPPPSAETHPAPVELEPAPPSVAEEPTSPAVSEEPELPSVAAEPAAVEVVDVAPPPAETAAVPETRPAPVVAVNINARPWAHIEVDGREVGLTPLADLPLSPGEHRFRARLPDGRVVERTASIDRYRNRVLFH